MHGLWICHGTDHAYEARRWNMDHGWSWIIHESWVIDVCIMTPFKKLDFTRVDSPLEIRSFPTTHLSK